MKKDLKKQIKLIKYFGANMSSLKIYNLLFEQDEDEVEVEELEPKKDVTAGTKSRLSDTSVDNQIDTLLVKFESESLIDPDENELKETFDIKRFLREQEENEDKQDLDVDQFSASINRLLLNYENLLNIKTVILNRASEFLNQNYDEAAVEEFHEVMETNYDIQLKEFEREGDDVEPAAPQGVGAFDGGTGGAG